MEKEITIVIPCYNESKSLAKLFEACYVACASRKDIQFIFVNNGSIDDTEITLNQLLLEKKYSFGTSPKKSKNIKLYRNKLSCFSSRCDYGRTDCANGILCANLERSV